MRVVEDTEITSKSARKINKKQKSELAAKQLGVIGLTEEQLLSEKQ